MCNCDEKIIRAEPQARPARILSRLSGGGFLASVGGETVAVQDRSGRAAPGLTMTALQTGGSWRVT